MEDIVIQAAAENIHINIIIMAISIIKEAINVAQKVSSALAAFLVAKNDPHLF